MIESLQNKSIKQFLKLSQYKKTRNEQNKFVLEGLRAICDALQFKVKLSHILLTQKAFEKFKLKQIDLINCPIDIITENVAKKISSVEQNQGCFAIAEKLQYFNLNNITSTEKILALFKLNNPGNLGTLIRSAAAFNFNKIILTDCCDIYNPKVIRSSMSTLFKVKFLQYTSSETIAWLKCCKLKTYAAVVSKTTQSVNFSNTNGGCVLVIGSEAHGLSSDVLDCCKFKISIKMANNIESLNAAIAGSILMFSLNNSHKSIF